MIQAGGFDADQRFDLLQRLGVTVLCQAPTEYRLMAKLPTMARFDLSRLRHAVSAGEPLNPEVIKAFRDAFGLTVYDGYGQTENTLLVANTRAMEIKPGSMGLPTPGHDVVVIDDEGSEAPVGTEGDIALRGRPPSLFLGYWNAPEETSAVFREEWYLTGDRATRDEDGYLWFTGRADDVILSAAYRIGPFEVESALLEHPAVAESAVVGKPDADRGELVKAYVVLRPGFEPSDELVRELQEHVKAVTAPYKYPREIEFTSELPKTASGKIRRVELRDRERARGLLDTKPEPAVPQAEPAVPQAEPASRGRPGGDRPARGERASRRGGRRSQPKRHESPRRPSRHGSPRRRPRTSNRSRGRARSPAPRKRTPQRSRSDVTSRSAAAPSERPRRTSEPPRPRSGWPRSASARSPSSSRTAVEAQGPTPRRQPAASTTPLEEDEVEPGEERLSPALISRLRAYGRGEDEVEGEGDADPGVETEDEGATPTTTTHTPS